MKLPFRLPRNLELPIFLETFHEVDTNNLTTEGLLAKFPEAENRQSDAILVALVADFLSIPNCVGLCFMETSTHGYNFQDLAIQHPDNTFTVQRWDDLSKTLARSSRNLDLDLVDELRQLRLENHILRQHGANNNIDHKSGMQGRYSRIYIVIESDSEWLDYPNQLRSGIYKSTAVNRILYAMFGKDEDVTLIQHFS